MRVGKFYGWFIAACLSLTSLSLAADYSGTFGAQDFTLQLSGTQWRLHRHDHHQG